MPQYGRNVQSVTANSSTTAESTTGAPLQTYAQVKGGKTGTITTPAHDPNSHFGNTSAGSRANVDVLMYGNDTPSAFVNNQAVGIFGVTPTQMQNNISNAAKDRPAHAGWVIRKAGTGGIATATPTAVAGSKFANGETITLSNGTSNATLTITTNATSNMVALAVTVPGAGWVNTTMVANTFVRQAFVANIQVSGLVPNTYQNGDILTISNATATAAVATINTLANGSLTNTNCLILTNIGLFAHGTTNANITMAITNSTGGTAAGSTNTTIMTANFANSSGGGFTITLGGRAGRTMTETLIASGTVGAQTGVATPASSNGLNSGTTSQIYYPGG